ncbi:MAG: HEPN domain-containing protein [Solirubrobacterales bacterium]
MDDWLVLHGRYREDANALVAAGKHHTALYLYGYVAESVAKALALHQNPNPMKTHSIVALLNRGRMSTSGLTPAEHQYVTNRAVELRYELDLPVDWNDQLVACQRFATRVYQELNRRRRRRRR